VLSDTLPAGAEALGVFDNGLSSGYFSVEHALGIYDPHLFLAKRLGERLYLYKAATLPY
jgi:hypothetical protein